MQEICQKSHNNNKIHGLKSNHSIKVQELIKSTHYLAMQPLDYETYSLILEIIQINTSKT